MCSTFCSQDFFLIKKWRDGFLFCREKDMDLFAKNGKSQWSFGNYGMHNGTSLPVQNLEPSPNGICRLPLSPFPSRLLTRSILRFDPNNLNRSPSHLHEVIIIRSISKSFLCSVWFSCWALLYLLVVYLIDSRWLGKLSLKLMPFWMRISKSKLDCAVLSLLFGWYFFVFDKSDSREFHLDCHDLSSIRNWNTGLAKNPISTCLCFSSVSEVGHL